MAKTTKRMTSKPTDQGEKGAQRSASANKLPKSLSKSDSKTAKGEPTTVGKMLKTAKEAIAKIPARVPAPLKGKLKSRSKSSKATVGELAKLIDEKNSAKLNAKSKAPSISDTLAGEKKGAGKKNGFVSRAKNADLRAKTVPTGRKGAPAQPPLDDAGKRHH